MLNSKETVLIVDDIPQNISLMVELLQGSFHLLVANSGKRALEILASEKVPDLVLLDVMMPGMDGYEVIRIMKSHAHSRDIPVIFVTAKTDVVDETRGLALGAVDYIAKPVNPDLLLARINVHLRVHAAETALRKRALDLEDEVQQRTSENRIFQDVVIRAMASLAETRDNETGNHIIRTQNYVRLLASHWSRCSYRREDLSDDYIRQLYVCAPLHDIGKVGIPDEILLKPGKLTAEEFEIMKSHTTVGYEAIVRAERASGRSFDFLEPAKEIALYHQEKWDGSGYPYGLKGDAIPLSARLMAIADVYDALISVRVYKQAYSHEQSLQIMSEGKGRHFDPLLFDCFMELADEFREIAQRYAD